MCRMGISTAFLLVLHGMALAEDPATPHQPSADRGRLAVWNVLSPLSQSTAAYDNLWKQWGLKKKPAGFDRAVRQRYGLHEAPYDNHGMPMGLHKGPGPLFGQVISNDCLLCHASRVAGQTIIGLGNSTLDLQALFDEMAAGELLAVRPPVALSRSRGTIEASAAVFYLMQYRNPDLTSRNKLKLEFRDDLYHDLPAWWHLKRKETKFHTGSTDARSIRSMLTFLLSPTNSGAHIKQQHGKFADIRAYLLTLQPPKYPFAVDGQLARRGEAIFNKTCARCHGTYGGNGRYPNKIVSLEAIGTDPVLAADAASEKAAEYFMKSWFAQEKGPDGKKYIAAAPAGYQAPPLDGIWATAPYFHNASVPTVYHVLNSKARPKVFTRSYGTEKEDYDPVKLGHQSTELKRVPETEFSPYERRKIYDTTQPGRSNGGHRFGDRLSEEERMAVIEYLKTI